MAPAPFAENVTAPPPAAVATILVKAFTASTPPKSPSA